MGKPITNTQSNAGLYYNIIEDKVDKWTSLVW